MPLLCTPITPPDPALSPSRQIFGFLAMTNTESREAAQHHLIPKPSGTLCSAPCCRMAWQRDPNRGALHAAAGAPRCSWGKGGSLPPAWRDPRQHWGVPPSLSKPGALWRSFSCPSPQARGGGTAAASGFPLATAPLSVEESAAGFTDTWRSWKNDLTSPRDLQRWREV